MKDSQLISTWAMMFFATSLIVTGTSATIAWAIGMMLLCGSMIAYTKEKPD